MAMISAARRRFTNRVTTTREASTSDGANRHAQPRDRARDAEQILRLEEVGRRRERQFLELKVIGRLY